MRQADKNTHTNLRALARGAASLALLLLLAGCAVKPGIIFPPLAHAPQWPSPPDTARITYVGQLATSADLKSGLNGMEALGQAIFGKEAPHTMATPMALCTDGANRVFAADSSAKAVHVFDLETRKYALWQPGKGQPAMAQAVGVAWDATARRLLVSDSQDGLIFVFDAGGTCKGTLGQGILQRPVGLAVDSSGRIFVADSKAHQVLVLAADGRLLQRIGQRGTGAGEFNFPTSVALDRAGRLYVSDSLNFRVQQFDAAFKPTGSFGKKGDLPGYFAEPKGIATDSEGHIYVVDGQFENVQVYDDQGRVLMDFGQEGTGPGEFWLPTAIFIDPHDRLWVADSYNHRLQVFDYKAVAEPATQPEVK